MGRTGPLIRTFTFYSTSPGGNLGGSVGSGFFPATMEVDYVRVYETKTIGFRGPREANEGETRTFFIDNLPPGASVTYNVPAGSVVTPNPNNPGIFEVTFGSETGVVSATVTSDCGEELVGTQVKVNRGMTKEYSFENFDDDEEIIFNFATGNLAEVSNPSPSSLNPSALTGRYVRDPDSPFDVLVYDVNTLGDADDYVDGTRTFSIDIFSNAPAGTELLLQLETSATALPENFPMGRHSRYSVFTTQQNEWQRLTFNLVDQPDQSVSGNSVDKLILLFAPNRFTPLTAHWDNFDSYSFNPNSVFGATQLDFPLTASPNPAREEVVLSFTLPESAAYDLSLFDLTGKRVLHLPGNQGLVGEQSHQLSLTELPQGVYLAQLRFADGIRTVKIVRQ